MVACDNCRTARVKCENLAGKCDRCRNLKVNCTYYHFAKKERPCVICKVKKRICDKIKPRCRFCIKYGDDCEYLEPNVSFPEYMKKREKVSDLRWKIYNQIKALPNFGKKLTILTVSNQNNTTNNVIFSFDPSLNTWANKQAYPDGFRAAILTFANQFIIPTLPESKSVATINRKFHLTGILINHLLELFYFNIGAYHPIVPRAYLNYLLLYRSKENSTLLLLYSICLAASNNFEALPLCSILNKEFGDQVSKLYKLCYTKSNLPFLMTNVLLSLLSSKDINNPNISTQTFYHCQAVRIAHQLGVHLESSKYSDVRNEINCRLYHNMGIHDIVLLRQSVNHKSYLHEFFVPREPAFCKEIDNYTLKSTPLAPELIVSHYQPYLVLKVQLHIINISVRVARLNTRYLAYIGNCKQLKTTPDPRKFIPETLSIENKLHRGFFIFPFTQGSMPLNPNIIEVPEDPALIQSFFVYMSFITDIHGYFINFVDNELLYKYDFSNKQVLISRFVNFNCEMKVIIAILFASNAIIQHQDHYMNSSVFYERITVLSLMLLMERVIKSLLSFKRKPPVVDMLINNYQQIVSILNKYKARFPILVTLLNSIKPLDLIIKV